MLDRVENDHAKPVADLGLNHGAASAFGIVVPGEVKAADSDDSLIDLTPVQAMPGRQLLLRRVADDELGDP
jgi:hypothetical protein